jgi:hypothetical protein
MPVCQDFQAHKVFPVFVVIRATAVSNIIHVHSTIVLQDFPDHLVCQA